MVREEHFRIEVILWRANVAATHHHGPPGAFQVLMGRRLNNEYRFTSLGAEGTGIDLGELDRTHTTLLRVGDVCPIPQGDGVIHDLAFLDPLCLTISVRARKWESTISDNSLYLAPHVRYSPRCLLDRRRSALESMTRTGAWRSPAQVRDVLRRSPAYAFALLQSVADAAPAAFAELAAQVEQAHGEKGRLLTRSLRAQAHRQRLADALQNVPTGGQPEAGFAQRLVLGLAWTGLDQAEALRVLAGNPGCRPADLLQAGAAAVRAARGPSIVALSPLLAGPGGEGGAAVRPSVVPCLAHSCSP